MKVFFGERDRLNGAFLADRILDVIIAAGLDRSVILRGSEGFGSKHRLQSAGLLTLSEDLPVIAEATGLREPVERAADEVRSLSENGLVTVEEVESLGAGGEVAGLATGITVWLRRGQRLGSEPAHVAVVRLLADQGAAAAVSLLGVDGTAAAARRERAKFFSWNGSVPMVVTALGNPDSIRRSARQIRALLPGVMIEMPGAAGPSARDGECRLTVFGTEAPGPRGAPIHSALLREVRGSGGSGATVVSGIYGFTGSGPARGDSVFQLRRRVPVLTEIVDTPEACDRWEEAAREIGAEPLAIARSAVAALRFPRG